MGISRICSILLLKNIPWYGYTNVCLTICWRTSLSHFGVFWIKLLWTFMHNFLCECNLLHLWDKYPGAQFLGHKVVTYLVFKETVKLISRVVVPYHIPINNIQCLSIILWAFGGVKFFKKVAILIGVHQYLIMVLTQFPSMACDVEIFSRAYLASLPPLHEQSLHIYFYIL